MSHFEKMASFQKIKRKLPNAAMSILGLFSATQQKMLHKVLWHLVSDFPQINAELIASHSIPCCIIANINDPLHPYEMAEKLHETINGSKLHKVTSRYINDQKHKKEVRAIIEKFLS